jgi:hypothetical protein
MCVLSSDNFSAYGAIVTYMTYLLSSENCSVHGAIVT